MYMDISSYASSPVMSLLQAQITQNSTGAYALKEAIDVHETLGLMLAEMIRSVSEIDHQLDIYA